MKKEEQNNYETKVYGSNVEEADKNMKEIFGEEFQWTKNPWEK